VFLGEKEIASARAEFVKRDTRQVRPMARCPSVPLYYLNNCSKYSRTLVLLPRPPLLNVSPFLLSDWFVLRFRLPLRLHYLGQVAHDQLMR
jgi:hypothetical protein